MVKNLCHRLSSSGKFVDHASLNLRCQRIHCRATKASEHQLSRRIFISLCFRCLLDWKFPLELHCSIDISSRYYATVRFSTSLHYENISRSAPQGKSSVKQFMYSFHWNLLSSRKQDVYALLLPFPAFEASREETKTENIIHTPFIFGKKKKNLKVPIVGAFVCVQQLHTSFSNWFVEPRLRACVYEHRALSLLLERWLYFLFSFPLTLSLRTHYENFHVHHRRLITCEEHISRLCVRLETLWKCERNVVWRSSHNCETESKHFR